MRHPRVVRAAEAARLRLESRPASFILGARFVPLGRVAMNYVAGATGFSRRIFLRCTAVSAVGWSIYVVLIGSVTGSWLQHAPFVAAVLGIVLALLVGVAIDLITRRKGLRARTAEVG
jgi:membrane-associated protein